MKVQVYDPPMCCSTGVCGPSVDPALVRFAADLAWLRESGVSVERFNLSQEPGAFAGNEAVKRAIESEGEEALPLIFKDGQAVSKGRYPESRQQLLGWLGDPELGQQQGCCGGDTEATTTSQACCGGGTGESCCGGDGEESCCGDRAESALFTEAVAELVAIGAAVAARCEPCFKFHYDKARKLGVSGEDMQRAVELARSVKDAADRHIAELTDRFLKQAESAQGLAGAPELPMSKCC